MAILISKRISISSLPLGALQQADAGSESFVELDLVTSETHIPGTQRGRPDDEVNKPLDKPETKYVSLPPHDAKNGVAKAVAAILAYGQQGGGKASPSWSWQPQFDADYVLGLDEDGKLVRAPGKKNLDFELIEPHRYATGNTLLQGESLHGARVFPLVKDKDVKDFEKYIGGMNRLEESRKRDNHNFYH